MKPVLPSCGHLWPFGSVVKDDARQTAQRRARKANSGFEGFECVCALVYTGVWIHSGQLQWCQNTSQWKQTLTGADVLSICAMSTCIHSSTGAFLHLCGGECSTAWMCLSVFYADEGLCTMSGNVGGRSGDGREIVEVTNCELAPLHATSQKLNCHLVKSGSWLMSTLSKHIYVHAKLDCIWNDLMKSA